MTTDGALIGIRALRDVNAVLSALPGDSPDPAVAGAREACDWAVGRRHDGPVTHAELPGSLPSLVQLDSERRAAWRTVEEPLAGRRQRRRALGVARALTWLVDVSAAPP